LTAFEGGSGRRVPSNNILVRLEWPHRVGPFNLNFAVFYLHLLNLNNDRQRRLLLQFKLAVPNLLLLLFDLFLTHHEPLLLEQLLYREAILRLLLQTAL